ncbi:MAG: TIGR00282 family metallophosphoesterase, partial [Lentisphaeria bacterium]
DHIWDQKQFLGEIGMFPWVLRPANLNKSQPGCGYGIYIAKNGSRVGVINLLGRVFMGMRSNCPFEEVDRILDELYGKVDYLFVDFHAEATSEKLAMGRYLDGRVSCVVGTHTHVQTNDATIFPKGSGYLTDLGMVGCIESILGRKISAVVSGFATGVSSSLEVAKGIVKLCGSVASFDCLTGKCTNIETIQREYSK